MTDETATLAERARALLDALGATELDALAALAALDRSNTGSSGPADERGA